LKDGIDFFARKYPSMKYLAYFQSYTNTYDSVGKLIELYREALSYPDVVGWSSARVPIACPTNCSIIWKS
jgi:radical SAM superfamily enzyme